MQSNDICDYCERKDTWYCMDCDVQVYGETEFKGIDMDGDK